MNWRPSRLISFALAVLLHLSMADPASSQAIVTESFEDCTPGRLTCHGWTGGGVIEEVRGDRVLVTPAGRAAVRSVFFPVDGVRMLAGSTYQVSASIRTFSLQHPVSLSSRLVDADGRPLTNPAVVHGAAGTSSWHRLQLAVAPVQTGRFELSFEIPASDSAGHAASAYIDDVEVQLVDVASPESGFANICPEGLFIDLAHSENECRQLDVTVGDLPAGLLNTLSDVLHVDVDRITSGGPSALLGFDQKVFWSGFLPWASNTVEVADCEAATIAAAIESVGSAGGGTVRLPHCRQAITQTITLSGIENVTLEGRGIGRTVLERPATGPAGPLISIDRSQNVIVRDMGFKLNGVQFSNISVGRSTNILFERIAVADPGSSGIRSQHTTRLTIRYSVFEDGPGSFGDPGCQDGWFTGPPPQKGDLDGDTKGSIYECEKKWGNDFAPGSGWSASYSMYSNITTDNSFAMHAMLGEIAGNRFIRTTGSKLSDGQFWWVHHNEFAGNGRGGARTPTFWTTSDAIVDRGSRHNLVYANRFTDLVNTPIRTHGGTNHVFGNEYVSIVEAPRFGRTTVICPGTEEAAWAGSGASGVGRPILAEGPEADFCTLERPGTFWSLPNVSFN